MTEARLEDGQRPRRYWRYKNSKRLSLGQEYRPLQEMRDITAVINEDKQKAINN